MTLRTVGEEDSELRDAGGSSGGGEWQPLATAGDDG